MPKIIKNSNYRVVIEPQDLSNIERRFHKDPESVEKSIKNRCNDIAESIKRHVDNIDRVDIEFDTDETCSHCGLEWCEDYNGLPTCCTEALAEMQIEKGSNLILNP